MPTTVALEASPLPRSRLLLAALFACVALTMSPAPGSGHDFWIQPATHRPQVNQPLFLWLKVGDAFRGENVAYLPPRVEHFIVYGPDGSETAPLPLETDDPAGLVRLTAPGSYEIAYMSRPQETQLSGDRFESYLQEEGLMEVSRLRREQGVSDQIAREQFMRCAKAQLRVRPESASTSAPTSAPTVGPSRQDLAPVGLPLELMMDRRDNRDDSGLVAVRLLFQGQPLSGALVVATPESSPQARVMERTDEAGRVRLPMDRAGVWMIKSVHMEPAPPGSSTDYFSWWASLTLEIDRPTPPSVPSKPFSKPAP